MMKNESPTISIPKKALFYTVICFFLKFCLLLPVSVYVDSLL